jgi:hypothetical protein
MTSVPMFPRQRLPKHSCPLVAIALVWLGRDWHRQLSSITSQFGIYCFDIHRLGPDAEYAQLWRGLDSDKFVLG